MDNKKQTKEPVTQMSEAAREARNAYTREYTREWRKRNPEKKKAADIRYWEKKALENQAGRTEKKERCIPSIPRYEAGSEKGALEVYSVKIDENIIAQWKAYCEIKGIPKGEATTRAICDYMSRHNFDTLNQYEEYKGRAEEIKQESKARKHARQNQE